MAEKIVTVGTVPVLLLDIMPGRREAKIQNQGSVSVYLGVRSDVAVSGTRKGLELPAGSVCDLNAVDDPELIRGPIYAVSAGTVEVYVWEA